MQASVTQFSKASFLTFLEERRPTNRLLHRLVGQSQAEEKEGLKKAPIKSYSGVFCAPAVAPALASPGNIKTFQTTGSWESKKTGQSKTFKNALGWQGFDIFLKASDW